MAYQATYQATLFLTGSGLGVTGPIMQDTQQTQPTNVNAPPLTSQLTVDDAVTTIVLPSVASGFAFTKVVLMPPSGSSIAKYLCTVGGSRLYPSSSSNNWTTGSVTLPAGPGDTIYVFAMGTEYLVIGFA
jgi:hypothetical protein